MATEARYGWELPDLGDVADGPFAFDEFAKDVSNTVADVTLQSYTPQWGSLGASQPGGTTSREGKYAIRNGWCDVSIFLTFGAGTSGGTGQLYVTLPVAPNNAIKFYQFQTMLYSPGYGWWHGWGNANSSSNRLTPYFAHDVVAGLTFPWSNATDGNTPGTGFPRINGTWAIQNAGEFHAYGRYYVG